MPVGRSMRVQIGCRLELFEQSDGARQEDVEIGWNAVGSESGLVTELEQIAQELDVVWIEVEWIQLIVEHRLGDGGSRTLEFFAKLFLQKSEKEGKEHGGIALSRKLAQFGNSPSGKMCDAVTAVEIGIGGEAVLAPAPKEGCEEGGERQGLESEEPGLGEERRLCRCMKDEARFDVNKTGPEVAGIIIRGGRKTRRLGCD